MAPESPMPPQGAAEETQEAGSPAEMLNAAGTMLQKFTDMVGQDKGVPPEAQKAFQTAMSAFNAGAQILQGGGAQSQGTMSPEQGASGAMPMSMNRP